MLTFISRTIGFLVVVTLMAIGADTVLNKILDWKDGYDRRNGFTAS